MSNKRLRTPRELANDVVSNPHWIKLTGGGGTRTSKFHGSLLADEIVKAIEEALEQAAQIAVDQQAPKVAAAIRQLKSK